MLIGLTGSPHAGQKEVVKYLGKIYGFQEVCCSEKDHQGNVIKNDFNCLIFESFNKAIDHITWNWKSKLENGFPFLFQPYRSLPLSASDYQMALKRPFFCLVAVESPVLTRFERFLKLVKLESCLDDDQLTLFKVSLDDASLEPQKNHHLELTRFLLRDQSHLYACTNNSKCLYDFIRMAQVTIFNNSSSIQELHGKIEQADLLNPEHTRPSFDTYFMALCELASRRSNCMKRRVGCILVSENRVISTGYNGTPRKVKNCNDGGCSRCNSGTSCGTSLDQCICLHAEENALLEAGRERITNRNVTLYCNTCPCLGCAKKIVQMGVVAVIYAQDYGMDELTKSLLLQGGVNLKRIPFLEKGIV